MYTGIGKEKYIRDSELIGIFDLDITSQSHLTRRFLSDSEKSGRVINAADDIPKSFVILKDKSVCLSQMATATLARRVEEVK